MDVATASDYAATFAELDATKRSLPELERTLEDAKIREAAASLARREAEAAVQKAKQAGGYFLQKYVQDHWVTVTAGRAVARTTEPPSFYQHNFAPDDTNLAGRKLVVTSWGNLAQELPGSGFGLSLRDPKTETVYIIIPTECQLEFGDRYREN